MKIIEQNSVHGSLSKKTQKGGGGGGGVALKPAYDSISEVLYDF